MKSNKLIWMLVTILISGTVAVNFEAINVYGQERPAVVPKATPPINGPDLSKYGIADYDAAESLEASVLERRKRVSRRYDNEGWVIHNPQDRFGKIGRHTESIPPPLIPTEESDVIAVGKVTVVTAHLSNDKSGVYSEFTVKISEVLKNGLSNDLERGGTITIDRAGGVLRYPSGNTVLYLDSAKGLPEAGREYALFLRADKKSDNFEIITLHELQDARTVPLDSGRKADDIRRMGRDNFIRAVRDKLSRPGVDEESRKDPKSKANDSPLKITKKCHNSNEPITRLHSL